MRRRRGEEPEDQGIAELAALADGTLAEGPRASVEARIAESPELAEQLAEQRQAIALVRSAGAGVEAPPALRARIEAQRRPAPSRSARRLRIVVPATAAALALSVAVVAIIGSA